MILLIQIQRSIILNIYVNLSYPLCPNIDPQGNIKVTNCVQIVVLPTTYW